MVWGWKCGQVRVNGESCMALLDNGTEINTIMPRCVKTHFLDVRSLSDLVGRWFTYVSLQNAFTQPLGYVVIWVQVDGVQGYDEDQIALVIPDLSNFAVWVPIILGTPTISCVINVMKEREIDTLGKCPKGPSPVSTKGCSHSGRWPNNWEFKLGWIRQNSPHQEYRDHQCLLILCDNHNGRYSSYW